MRHLRAYFKRSHGLCLCLLRTPQPRKPPPHATLQFDEHFFFKGYFFHCRCLHFSDKLVWQMVSSWISRAPIHRRNQHDWERPLRQHVEKYVPHGRKVFHKNKFYIRKYYSSTLRQGKARERKFTKLWDIKFYESVLVRIKT